MTVTRVWKHPNGSITRFSGIEDSDYDTLSTEMFPPGTVEIEVGGPEDVDPPPSCQYGECHETMAVAQIHVQGPQDCGMWRIGPGVFELVRKPDSEERVWYHMWMCAEHLKDFVDSICNCPGADRPHNKCNCPACPHGKHAA